MVLGKLLWSEALSQKRLVNTASSVLHNLQMGRCLSTTGWWDFQEVGIMDIPPSDYTYSSLFQLTSEINQINLRYTTILTCALGALESWWPQNFSSVSQTTDFWLQLMETFQSLWKKEAWNRTDVNTAQFPTLCRGTVLSLTSPPPVRQHGVCSLPKLQFCPCK